MNTHWHEGCAHDLRISLCDGREEAAWQSDPGSLRPGHLQHVVAIADGGPKLLLFVVDGVLCDGGDARQFGWGRFSPTLRSANGGPELRIGPELAGRVRALRIYDRALRVSEAVGNYQARGPWAGG